jgi:hypothetical protein
MKISRVHDLLASCVCVGAQHNPDDLGDASWWCGTVYHIIVGWMGKIVLLGAQEQEEDNAATVIGEVRQKISRALTPILASTAFTLVHNSQ